MDPIREALKLKLQLSPRLPDPNDSNSSSASVLIPKLFDMGFNHQKQSSLNPARSKGFSIDKQGYNRDSRSDSISASNSPRPTVSPRGLGELPVQMNPAHTHSQRLNDANKVLRFFAYFKEVMIFSNVESERVRKCIILFYLADGSMEIVEEKVSTCYCCQLLLCVFVSFPVQCSQNHPHRVSMLHSTANACCMYAAVMPRLNHSYLHVFACRARARPERANVRLSDMCTIA